MADVIKATERDLMAQPLRRLAEVVLLLDPGCHSGCQGATSTLA